MKMKLFMEIHSFLHSQLPVVSSGQNILTKNKGPNSPIYSVF